MRKKLVICLCLCLLLALHPRAYAAEITEIRTAEDLQAMAEDPSGSYILMNDLDMTGVDWTPVDLNGGSFDGNGYGILNLSVTRAGDTVGTSYDGNEINYDDTTFAGLFGILRNARVTNLKLVNVRALVESDVPCFLGGIAGAMYDSVIADCTVTGCLEIRAHDRIFGVGGVAGYGTGAIERCKVDVTLICTDTNPARRDEQFLGGIYATGFTDVTDCAVTIDGYASEWGYAHNGGIVGMAMQRMEEMGRINHISGNTVTGKITFFECNSDRRAYCGPLYGEDLIVSYVRMGNSSDFVRDERWDYSVELRPETCQEPTYTQRIVAAGCDTYGYTEYTCDGCGYTYTDCYTLTAHTVTAWQVTREPTTEEEGLSVAYCDGCGLEFSRTVEKLEPVPTETQTAPATEPAPTEPAQKEENRSDWRVSGIAVAAAGIVLVLLLLRPRRSGKYQK